MKGRIYLNTKESTTVFFASSFFISLFEVCDMRCRKKKKRFPYCVKLVKIRTMHIVKNETYKSKTQILTKPIKFKL
jgi:hypothetical protein